MALYFSTRSVTRTLQKKATSQFVDQMSHRCFISLIHDNQLSGSHFGNRSQYISCSQTLGALKSRLMDHELLSKCNKAKSSLQAHVNSLLSYIHFRTSRVTFWFHRVATRWRCPAVFVKTLAWVGVFILEGSETSF